MDKIKITLKAARVNAGKSQKDAADFLKVSTETIKNYEKGKTMPDINQVIRLSEFYGFPYDNIIFFKS